MKNLLLIFMLLFAVDSIAQLDQREKGDVVSPALNKNPNFIQKTGWTIEAIDPINDTLCTVQPKADNLSIQTADVCNARVYQDINSADIRKARFAKETMTVSLKIQSMGYVKITLNVYKKAATTGTLTLLRTRSLENNSGVLLRNKKIVFDVVTEDLNFVANANLADSLRIEFTFEPTVVFPAGVAEVEVSDFRVFSSLLNYSPFIHEINESDSMVTSFNEAVITMPVGVDTLLPAANLVGDLTNYSLESGAIKVSKAGKYKIRAESQFYGSGEGFIIKLVVNNVANPTTRVGYLDNSLAGSYSFIPAEWIVDLPAGAEVKIFATTPYNTRDARFTTISLTKIVASNPNILTPPDTFSTDYNPLTYASSSQYNLTTLADAPVGTYITFTYAANTNTRVQTTTRPTQTDADMMLNGMRIYTRVFNAASTAASPAAFAIQIGKGMKGTSLGLYKNVGKSVTGQINPWSKEVIRYGIEINNYDESTGIILIDAGFDTVIGAVNTTAALLFSNGTFQDNGYLTINASKNPALVGIHRPARYIVKTYKSGSDSYVVYNDGWVEQRGKVTPLSTAGATTNAINFHIEMLDTSYDNDLGGEGGSISGTYFTRQFTARTTTGATLSSFNVESIPVSWIIKGYGNAAAVRALGANPSY